MSEKCPFCNPRKENIVYEDANVYAVYDNFPVSAGHTLVISRRHAPTLFDLTIEERAAMMGCLDEIKSKLDEKFHPDGFNIGFNCGEVAGQTIGHCHMHVIPRYSGDVPEPRGGVRGVIPSKRSYGDDGDNA